MLYQHLLDLKEVCIAIHPLPLVDSLYTCEDVDNCERPLTQFICRKPSIVRYVTFTYTGSIPGGILS